VAQLVTQVAPDRVVEDTVKAHRKYFTILPVAFTGPATGPGIGISGLWLRPSRDSATRTSQVQAVAYVTSKKQLDLLAAADFWSRGNRDHLNIQTEESLYPTPFYGVGPTDPTFPEEEYKLTLLSLAVRYQRRIGPNLFIGVGVGTRHAGIDVDDSVLATQKDTIPGMDGSGVYFGELSLQLDTRDNLINPSHGGSVLLRLQEAPGILGTSFTYLDFYADTRRYFHVGRLGTLALQASWETLRGVAPFDVLPNFGGPNDLRGYVNNRWRAHNAVITQVELRTPIAGRFGFATFFGAGAVFDHLSESATDQIRPSYGVGLRYMIVPAQRANIRLDVGFGQNSHAIYAGFGEAF
jgi:outer membrane protein assembly factor BamA